MHTPNQSKTLYLRQQMFIFFLCGFVDQPCVFRSESSYLGWEDFGISSWNISGGWQCLVEGTVLNCLIAGLNYKGQVHIDLIIVQQDSPNSLVQRWKAPATRIDKPPMHMIAYITACIYPTAPSKTMARSWMKGLRN